MSIELAISRGDFLFAGKRSRGRGQTRSGRNNIQQLSPQQPDRNPFKGLFTRRRLVIGAVTVGAAAVVLAGADQLGIQNPFRPTPEPPLPETLEGMVIEAKKMEDSFKDNDLSNKQTRQKYTNLLAGIFALNYQNFLTKEQILSTMVWTDSIDDFVAERLKSSTHPLLSEPAYRKEAPDTTAATDIRTRRMVINTKADIFNQRALNNLKSPYKWNPLKMLRISLFHEFGHLVNTNSDDQLYVIVDPQNGIRNKVIEGFRITGEDDKGYPTILNNVHEAAIELFSKELNEKYFGSFFSNYINGAGDGIDIVRDNLDKVLQAAGISKDETSSYHKGSRLKEFLILLTQKVGATDKDPVLNRLTFALRVMTAIDSSDQGFIQSFINLANLHNKTPQQ